MQPSDLVHGLNRLVGGLDLEGGAPGWGRVRWGMSRRAVAVGYPGAVEKEGELVRSFSGPPDKAYALSFGFDSGHRLQTVKLSFAGSREAADFAALAERLIRQLGAPTAQDAGGMSWQAGETAISLSREPGGGVALSRVV
jgi:hypothetical protein